jgi:hypothetical protein
MMSRLDGSMSQAADNTLRAAEAMTDAAVSDWLREPLRTAIE